MLFEHDDDDDVDLRYIRFEAEHSAIGIRFSVEIIAVVNWWAYVFNFTSSLIIHSIEIYCFIEHNIFERRKKKEGILLLSLLLTFECRIALGIVEISLPFITPTKCLCHWSEIHLSYVNNVPMHNVEYARKN